MLRNCILLGAISACCALGQNWEVGVVGGYGFLSNNLELKSATSSVNATLAKGYAVGVFGGEDTYKYVSGEARYLYHDTGVRLTSGSTRADFSAHEHIAEAAFLVHATPRKAKVRPFLAAGIGVKSLVGTGFERASQPLGNFAALTATREVMLTGDIGAGVKANLSTHSRLRLEVRDYITGAPNDVIAPAQGIHVGGWLHDVLGLASISYTF